MCSYNTNTLDTNQATAFVIHDALKPLAKLQQFVSYRLEQKENGKTDKIPVRPGTDIMCNAHDPDNWVTIDKAGPQPAFVFTKDGGRFFIDVDNCITQDRKWSDLALSLSQMFRGCAFEVSQSGKGLHIYGRIPQGVNLQHSCRKDDLGLEFYTEGRFVALTGRCYDGGNADYEPNADTYKLFIDTYFPPNNTAGADPTAADDWTDGPASEWYGPKDDEELLAKALKSRGAKSIIGRGVTFKQLWEADEDALSKVFPDEGGGRNRPFDWSQADAALCAHLAFWTGKDAERMAGLWGRSALGQRDKFNRPDYQQGTILNACRLCENVYTGGSLSQDYTDIFQPKTITADFSPARLPRREWIILGSVLTGHVSIIVGPGGVCKSIYTLVMCMLVAARGLRSETDLIGPVRQYAKTLVINNEDDQVEMERRIAGVMRAYSIQPSELEDRFFYESGYGARRLICEETDTGEVVQAPLVDRLLEYIKDHGIKLVVIDPFVSSHRSNENDNSKVDDIVQIYKSIAAKTQSAIVLVHHTRKGNADEPPTIEASRGGKALSDGCRVGEIILPLSQADKKHFGLSDDEARDIVRMDSVKANYSRKGAGSYFRLESVELGNGDRVGVPRRIELKEKAQDKGDRAVGIAQFIAMEVIEKEGPKGGTIPWSELRASYMAHAKVGATRASEEVTLLPKGRERAQRIHVDNVSYQIWYEKGAARTSPIMVYVEAGVAGSPAVAGVAGAGNDDISTMG